MDKKYLSNLITDTIKGIGKYSPNAVNLILGTIAQESAFGKYRRQLGSGIALGICQIEPNTFYDIIDNYLRYKPELRLKVLEVSGLFELNHEELVNNDRLSIAMCRVFYSRFPEALPSTVDGMAKLWKYRYNTKYGKGTEEEFIKNYNKYVLK